jgi:hypothetical protein
MTATVWGPFLVNFFFWSGLSIGAQIFSALLKLTDATWALPLQPIARRFGRFLPVSFALYAVFAAAGMFRWRDAAALAASYIAAFSNPVASVIVYPVAWSLVAIDVLMAMDPGWVSTLFPAYVFTANVYAGIAAVAVAAFVSLPRRVLERGVARDLGSVLLGFALIWIYFTWTQFLVIWYGNLPRETGYVATRLSGGWQPVAWIVLGTRCALPAAVLMTRAGKRRIPLALTASLVFVGFWIECWWLIVPSLPGRMSAASTAAITAVFCLLFAASLLQLPRRRRPQSAPLQTATAAAARANSL